MRGFKKKPNAYVYKYVGQRGLVAMPANKSAGIKPGVNLSYPLHTGNKAHRLPPLFKQTKPCLGCIHSQHQR